MPSSMRKMHRFRSSCIYVKYYLGLLWPQLDAHLTGDQEVRGSTPTEVSNILLEIDHEIFSTVILSLPLIQEG